MVSPTRFPAAFGPLEGKRELLLCPALAAVVPARAATDLTQLSLEQLLIFGRDPFGEGIDPLQGKKVGDRSIAIHRKTSVESLKSCQIVFIANLAIGSLPRVLDSVRGTPVLTVADSPGSAAQGVALNMGEAQNRITFEADLQAAREAGLSLSSKLLRLATEVRQ
jgi:hypothetical protein